ncbi:MAG: hypothetical protein AAFO95_19395 [Cyanobacteria bacterium J06600_6]
MRKHSIDKWCKQNNWSEPRQLESGNWVAFPPGGAIETPLPSTANINSSYLQDLIYGLILVFAIAIVGAVSLIISPLFLTAIIQRHRRRCSMSKLKTYN